MYLIKRYERAIACVVNSDSRRALLVAGIVTASIVGSLAAIFGGIGAPVMNGRPGDVPICLDGAWRIANGQVPHRDFYSHLGSFPFYLAWLGMKLGHPSVSSIMYGNIVLMLLISALAFFALCRRTSALYTCLLSCFLGVLVVAPRALGEPYDFVDHAMVYNRFGEAFLILLSILVLVPPRPRNRQAVTQGLDTMLAGLLVSLLFFTKINYFAVGTALIFSAGVLKCWGAGRVLSCALCAAILTALLLNLTSIPLSAMIEDFRLTAGMQDAGWRAKNLAVQLAKQGLPLSLLALLAAEAFFGQPPKEPSRLVRLRIWLIPGMLFLAGSFLLASNCQASEMPLLAAAALYCAELIRRQSALLVDAVYSAAVRSSIACGLVLCLVLPTLGPDLATIRHATREALAHDFVSSETLKRTNLEDFRFSRTGSRDLYSQRYLLSLEEGIQLLRRQTNSEMKLQVVLFANPFHLALGLPPARGGTTCWVWSTWDKGPKLPLRRLLGNATHILTGPGCQELRKTYGAEWDSLRVETIEETENFSLVRLKSQLAARD